MADPSGSPQQGTLLLRSAIACSVLVDGSVRLELEGGQALAETVQAGEHILVATFPETGARQELVVSVPAGHQKVVLLDPGPAPAAEVPTEPAPPGEQSPGGAPRTRRLVATLGITAVALAAAGWWYWTVQRPYAAAVAEADALFAESRWAEALDAYAAADAYRSGTAHVEERMAAAAERRMLFRHEEWGGYGFVDKTGEWVIPPRFDYAQDFRDGRAAVRVGDRYGVIDRAGLWVAHPQFDAILIDNLEGGGKAVVTLDDHRGVIDRDGEWIVRPRYATIDFWSEGRTRVSRGWPPAATHLGLFAHFDQYEVGWGDDQVGAARFGFIDESGEEVVDPSFWDASSFSDGLARVTPARDGLTGYIDGSGALVIPARFMTASDFHDGLALANGRSGDVFGYIDRSGEWAIPAGYQGATAFQDGLAAVQPFGGDGGWGYIDTDDELVTDFRFAWTGLFEDGRAVVGERLEDGTRKCGGIDNTGEYVVPPSFDACRWLDGLFTVSDGDGWTTFDAAGTRLGSGPDPGLPYFYRGYARVTRDGRPGWVDPTGVFVSAPEPPGPRYTFVEGLAGVRHDGLWGFIDASGAMVVEPTFDAALSFNEGLAAVRRGDRWGFVDPSGEVVTPTIFRGVRSFRGGLAARRGADLEWEGERIHQWGFQDREGRWVGWGPYGEVGGFSEGLASVGNPLEFWAAREYIGYGFIDESGREVVSPRAGYGRVHDFSGGLARVVVGSEMAMENFDPPRFAFVNTAGRRVIRLDWESWADDVAEGKLRVRAGSGDYSYLSVGGGDIGTTGRSFEWASQFAGGFARYVEDGRWGMIDRRERTVIEPLYDWVSGVADGRVRIVLDGKAGFADTTGAVVVSPAFDDAEDFSEGFAAVRVGDLWGYIDLSGANVIPLRFDWGAGFSDGRARVLVDGRWGFVRPNGELMTYDLDASETPFRAATDFREQRAWVALDGGGAFIDTEGAVVWEEGQAPVTPPAQSESDAPEDRQPDPVEAQPVETSGDEATPAPEPEESFVEDPEIYTVVEEMPAFPGGDEELMAFIEANLRYPEVARANGIEGLVVVRFVVMEDGSRESIEVLRDIGGGAAQEVIRLVGSMPAWSPGRKEGRPVKVVFSLPVRFRLD